MKKLSLVMTITLGSIQLTNAFENSAQIVKDVDCFEAATETCNKYEELAGCMSAEEYGDLWFMLYENCHGVPF